MGFSDPYWKFAVTAWEVHGSLFSRLEIFMRFFALCAVVSYEFLRRDYKGGLLSEFCNILKILTTIWHRTSRVSDLLICLLPSEMHFRLSFPTYCVIFIVLNLRGAGCVNTRRPSYSQQGLDKIIDFSSSFE